MSNESKIIEIKFELLQKYRELTNLRKSNKDFTERIMNISNDIDTIELEIFLQECDLDWAEKRRAENKLKEDDKK